MLELRIHVPLDRAESLADGLSAVPGASELITIPEPHTARALVIGEVAHRDADGVLEAVAGLGVPDADVRLIRHALIPLPGDRGTPLREAALIWADLIAEARSTSRPGSRYLLLMGVAGVLAGFGVIQANAILIVGAMAVSPDLLPIVAAGVGIVGRRPPLILRSLGTLTLGLLTGAIAAGLLTRGLIAIGWLSPDFPLDQGFLGTLITLDLSSAIIGLSAGVAAMLAFETRASAAVGVAISVTTIPAAAFLGVALGAGRGPEAEGSMAVLLLNVSCIILGGALTLLAQRGLGRRRSGAAGRRVAP